MARRHTTPTTTNDATYADSLPVPLRAPDAMTVATTCVPTAPPMVRMLTFIPVVTPT